MENCLMAYPESELRAEVEWKRFKRGVCFGLLWSVCFWGIVVVIIIIL